MSNKAGLEVRKLQLIVDQIDNLPTLPAVATRVLALAASEDSSARDLTEIIEADQSLTGRILALVNSAGFSRGNPVTTVARAVGLLGFEAIRNSVLSLKVFDQFSRKGSSAFRSAFDRTGFWKHSLGVATAAQMIARRVRRVSPEEAFVCGLLHDIGKIALDYALPKTFDQVVRRVVAQRVTFASAELRILGLDHTAVGRRLAANWQFPDVLGNVIWLHHQGAEHLPEGVAGRELIEVVHLANLLVRRERVGASSPPDESGALADAAARLKLDDEHLKAVGKDLRTVVAEHVKTLGLENSDEQDLFCESLQHANAELGRMNQQLAATRRLLERQRRHAEALAALSRKVHEAETLSALQIALAREFMEWLDAAVCVVYCFGADLGYVEGTLAARARRQTERFLFETTGAEGEVLPAAGGQYGLTRAERSEAWLFERLGERMGEGEFYSYPLWGGERPLGAVVFSWPEGRPVPTRAEADELGVLATAAGTAVIAWQRRERLAELAGKLAEANRAACEAQEELIERRNLASLGAMAAGAAHEINNPLAVVSGRAQMLVEIETDEKKRKSLQIVCQQAERASSIVSEMMNFSRPLAAVRRSTDVAVIVRKASQRVASQATEQGIDLTTEIVPDAPPACVDGAQVEWAVEELVENALAATESGGRVTIAVEHDPAGSLLTVSVADTGCGMDAETLARACDPFFSGRHSGKRHGLGLAKVRRIAEANAAGFRLDSTPGEGTVARLVFDVGDPAPQAGAAAQQETV